MRDWPIWGHVAALLCTLAVLGLMALATIAIVQGFDRGQDRRTAENNTKIARELLVQDALRQYREEH